MKSKGGKVIYLCDNCNGENIVRCGTVVRQLEGSRIEILGMYADRDDSYYCHDCGHFDWWQTRKRRSLKKPLPEVKTELQYPEDDLRRRCRAFYNHDSYAYARIELNPKPDFTFM